MRWFVVVLFAGPLLLTGCGGSSTSSGSHGAATSPLVGNWQIALTPGTPDPSLANPASYPPRTLSGFLQQSEGKVSGSMVYSLTCPLPQRLTPPATVPGPIVSGAGPISGSMSGQTLNLSINQSGQMTNLTGTLSADNSMITGTYTSPPGVCEDSTNTGTESGTWTASVVKPVNGMFQGVLHSTANGSTNFFGVGEDFLVGGSLTQGPNIGASNASLTGYIVAVNYPCLSAADTLLTGTISGTFVRLNLISRTGAVVGSLGAQFGTTSQFGATLSPDGSQLAGFQSASSGYSMLASKGCSQPIGSGVPPDQGNFCLNFGSSTSCQSPVALSTNLLTFPSVLVGDTSAPTQMVTLTNQTSGANAAGITTTLSIQARSGTTTPETPGDFHIVSQTCDPTQPVPPPQGPLSATLASQASCSMVIQFVPTGSCPLDPTLTPPAKCPLPRTAGLVADDGLSSDANNPHNVGLTGTGLSAVFPSVGELDFGQQTIGTTSPPETITFTNQGNSPVTLLPISTATDPTTGLVGCAYPPSSGTPSGLQVVGGAQVSNGIGGFTCDNNFTISADNCSGTTLSPQGICTVSVSFTPQPLLVQDEFLQINSSEPDTGRFPVELKGNQAIIPTPAAAAGKRKQ